MPRRNSLGNLLQPAALRFAALTGLVLALGAAALSWVSLQHSVRLIPTELYAIAIAIFFAVLGGWAGHSLTARRPETRVFSRNDAAMASLGVTVREYEVLTHIAGGRTNKEIARKLGVSPNTIKSQAASLFGKLGAARRIDAIRKARALSLIP
ncbi:MAG: LuxR C-terminal-related transcriptional regulator [Devosia sp.]